MDFEKNYGMLCLCAYLGLTCVFSLTNIQLAQGYLITGILAGASAVLLFMKK